MIDLDSLPPCGSCGRSWTPTIHDADEGERATYSLSCECGYLWEAEMPLPTWRKLADNLDHGWYFAALIGEVERLQGATRPSAPALYLGPILARAEAASDAYFDHLAPRCSYTSAGDGMGCGLSSGHDGPHVMLMPRDDGWRYVNEARTDIPALCAEVERLRAELAEAEATLANERGEGDPPVPGFVFIGNGGNRETWRHEVGSMGAYVTREIDNMARVRWAWSIIEDRYGGDESPRFVTHARGTAPTARAAMKAADAVRGVS